MKRVARGVCFDDLSLPLRQRKIVLIYEKGSWRLPGGHCEGAGNERESARRAIIREFKEETGLDVEVLTWLFGRTDSAANKQVYFLVKPIGGELIQKTSADGASPSWFLIGELSKVKLGFFWGPLIGRILSFLEQQERMRRKNFGRR